MSRLGAILAGSLLVMSSLHLCAAAEGGKMWATYGGDAANTRFSPLSQINATNINRLGPAWYADIPASPGLPQNRQEASPLAYNGKLYSIAPWSWCMRLTPVREKRYGVRIPR